MDKDKILQMSRTENEGMESEWEKSVADRASRAARVTGIALCFILALIDDWLLNTHIVGLASWIVYFAMEAANNIVLYASHKKRSMLVWFCIDILCAVCDLVMLMVFATR